MSRKRIEPKQFCHKENVYWKIHACVSSYDLSPGSDMQFHSFLLPGTDKEQKIHEKQHARILLLNVPWQVFLEVKEGELV